MFLVQENWKNHGFGFTTNNQQSQFCQYWVNFYPDWLCWLAGRFKTAPTILMFSKKHWDLTFLSLMFLSLTVVPTSRLVLHSYTIHKVDWIQRPILLNSLSKESFLLKRHWRTSESTRLFFWCFRLSFLTLRSKENCSHSGMKSFLKLHFC